MRQLNLIICLFLLSTVWLHAANITTYRSPDGKFAISTAGGASNSHYKVQLIDAATEQVLDSYDPEARAIEVFWSPDSRFVAINEDLSHTLGNLNVWLITGRNWKRVSMPEQVLDRVVTDDKKSGTSHTEEVIARLIPKNDARLVKFWLGGHQPLASQWHSSSDLEIEVNGEAEMQGDRHLTVTYSFVLRCFPDGTSKILEEKQIEYKIEPSTK